MEQKIKIFENEEFGKVRTIIKDGEPWFVGKDVAEKIYERHLFFTEQLVAVGVDQKTAEQDACRIEHAISEESFQKLKASVKK